MQNDNRLTPELKFVPNQKILIKYILTLGQHLQSVGKNVLMFVCWFVGRSINGHLNLWPCVKMVGKCRNVALGHANKFHKNSTKCLI